MIGNFFINLLEVLADFIFWLVDLLPALDFIGLGSIGGMVELIALTSCFMPWSTFFTALAIWIAFQQFKWVLGLANWIYDRIPFI